MFKGKLQDIQNASELLLKTTLRDYKKVWKQKYGELRDGSRLLHTTVCVCVCVCVRAHVEWSSPLLTPPLPLSCPSLG